MSDQDKSLYLVRRGQYTQYETVTNEDGSTRNKTNIFNPGDSIPLTKAEAIKLGDRVSPLNPSPADPVVVESTDEVESAVFVDDASDDSPDSPVDESPSTSWYSS